MEVELRYDSGILVEWGGKRVIFDPVKPPSLRPDVVAVTHCHRDHCSVRALRALGGVPKLLSRATREIIDPRKRIPNVVEVEEGEIEVEGIPFEVYEAGHVLGSLQFALNLDRRIVYTGDFNLERRIVLSPAPIVGADILVIEATYGHPRYVFPERRALYRLIVENVKAASEGGEGIVLAGRRIGVSQELTALVSFSRLGSPMVHPSVARINEVYERFGEMLGHYLVPLEPPAEEKRGDVLIAPLNYNSPYREVVRCTGWALSWSRGVPLSSHADFTQLVKYVQDSGAEMVYAVYGFSEAFSSYIRRELGVDSRPLGRP